MTTRTIIKYSDCISCGDCILFSEKMCEKCKKKDNSISEKIEEVTRNLDLLYSKNQESDEEPLSDELSDLKTIKNFGSKKYGPDLKGEYTVAYVCNIFTRGPKHKDEWTSESRYYRYLNIHRASTIDEEFRDSTYKINEMYKKAKEIVKNHPTPVCKRTIIRHNKQREKERFEMLQQNYLKLQKEHDNLIQRFDNFTKMFKNVK
jgi:hypothetical protein